jgi:uncharacterized protein YkwD
MRSSSRLALLLAAVAGAALHLTAAAGAPPGDPSLVQALSAVRTQGCGGRAGLPQGLGEASALTEAARRMSRGAPADQATRDAGYRARSLVQIQLSGYPSSQAVARAVADKHCPSLLDPAFTEAGVFRDGRNWWVLLAQPFSPPQAAQAGDVAARVLALVNEARAQPRRCGAEQFNAAAPVRLDDRLTRAAQVHSQDMARRGVLEHVGGDGSQVAQRVERTGYDWRSVGENVAAGQERAEEVVAGWLRSPGHCVNIMDPRFTDMGLAYVVDRASPAGIYWTQVFGRARR